MKIFIIFALVCCLAVLTVSSAKWTDAEDDTEVDDFDGDEEFSMDDEDKMMLYEDILDELIAASDPRIVRPPLCGKICKLCKTRCTRGKPKPPKVIAMCQKKCENPRN